MKRDWAYGKYTDRTLVAGTTWHKLKEKAMRPEYKQTDDYVSQFTSDQSNNYHFEQLTLDQEQKSLVDELIEVQTTH